MLIESLPAVGGPGTVGEEGDIAAVFPVGGPAWGVWDMEGDGMAKEDRGVDADGEEAAPEVVVFLTPAMELLVEAVDLEEIDTECGEVTGSQFRFGLDPDPCPAQEGIDAELAVAADEIAILAGAAEAFEGAVGDLLGGQALGWIRRKIEDTPDSETSGSGVACIGCEPIRSGEGVLIEEGQQFGPAVVDGVIAATRGSEALIRLEDMDQGKGQIRGEPAQGIEGGGGGAVVSDNDFVRQLALACQSEQDQSEGMRLIEGRKDGGDGRSHAIGPHPGLGLAWDRREGIRLQVGLFR